MNILTRLKINGKVLFKCFVSVWGTLSAFASILLDFFSWDELGIQKVTLKIIIFSGIVILSLIVSASIVLIRNKKSIFGDTDKEIFIQYGDIIELGFDNRRKDKKIIVIPVNRCFDLSCENNLISEKSIHGQWLNNYISSEKDRVELHQKIEQCLSDCNAEYKEIDFMDKKSGYLKRYSSGTIVELNETNGIIFYLWGVSEFDSNLKANSTEFDYFIALQNLIDYYDSHGQCIDLYCPVFGDHIIRPTRSTEDMLYFMVSLLRINKQKIHGNIHIIVHETKKADVAILKY